MKKNVFFGAAAVLVICGLLVSGCGDRSDGIHPLDGIWAAQAAGETPARDLKIMNGATRYEFSTNLGQGSVLIRGNIGSLVTGAAEGAYTATGTISSLSLAGTELDQLFLAVAGIPDKTQVSVPLTFLTAKADGLRTLIVDFGDPAQGILAGSTAQRMISVLQGRYRGR